MREMSQVPSRSRKRRSHPADQLGRVARSDGPFFPTRIPGVRIAFVGSQSKAAMEMQTYWQARGASFVHLALAEGAGAMGLKPLLSVADVVFYCAADISPEIR